MEAKWDEMRQMLTLPEHGIPRAEWRRRFLSEMVRLTNCSELVAEGEIEAWIENTLEGPGHLPDLASAKKEGGAQCMFNREMAEHEAFRAAHPAP